MPKSYTPNWFFTALLDNHINQLVARYSRLRALRMDFFYRKDTPDFLQPDHRWLELQLRMLLEQVEQFENIVGFFWVIEWTADHGFHAHAVFWYVILITRQEQSGRKKNCIKSLQAVQGIMSGYVQMKSIVILFLIVALHPRLK